MAIVATVTVHSGSAVNLLSVGCGLALCAQIDRRSSPRTLGYVLRTWRGRPTARILPGPVVRRLIDEWFGKVTVASKSFEFGNIAVIGSFMFVNPCHSNRYNSVSTTTQTHYILSNESKFAMGSRWEAFLSTARGGCICTPVRLSRTLAVCDSGSYSSAHVDMPKSKRESQY